VLGKVNVYFKFGRGKPPKKSKHEMGQPRKSECLIKVYASIDIEAGTELLASYGSDFWEGVNNPIDQTWSA
jgi:hypothetical protein